ncbi:MAG: transglycosylase domain-containing protein [Ferruginibacter sp.]
MSRSVKILWRLFFAVFGIALIMLLMANFGVFGRMPSFEELEHPEADLASEIISSDGVLMGKFYSENRSEVKYTEISPNVIHALIATEDERYYEHSGIDAQALARVIFTGGSQGGGSTITQQLAKMILGQGHGNVLVRGVQKIKEWIIAVKLERNFTKEEILTLYLNRAPWVNVYGIRNASRTYFQKEPVDLSVEESAVLVGMLKGSSIYEPINHPQNSINRRNTVINQMVVAKQKFLTPQEGEDLKRKPLITNYKKITENIGIAPYYRQELLDVLKDWCKSNTNPRTNAPYDLYRDGLKIYTTIDTRMQKYAEEAVEEHMPVIQAKTDRFLKARGDKIWKGHDEIIWSAAKYSDRWRTLKEDEMKDEDIKKIFRIPVKMKIFSWTGNDKHEKDSVMSPYDSIKYHKQLLQTSFAAMDPRTGEIKAWVGGINFKWFKYDHVLAKRQVGSTFKPLLYTLAVTDAGYTPETYIPGGSLTLNGKTITDHGGSMASLFAWSRNGGAWHLMSVIGVNRTIEFARQCGIKAAIPPYPSIALGSADIPLIEMLQSYTMFPNKGYNTEPVFLNRIEDKNGNLLHEFPISQSKQVISESDDYTMVNMMQGVIKFGTGRRLNGYKIPVEKAGKTGTTNGNTDGWFIGYTPDLLAGTWVGFEDPFIPIFESSGGAEMSAPRWGLFFEKVIADEKVPYGKIKTFDVPVNVDEGPINADIRLSDMNDPIDSLGQDMGNGSADDFYSEDQDVFIKPVDTSKKKKPDEKNPPLPPSASLPPVKTEADKKNGKQPDPVIQNPKPGDKNINPEQTGANPIPVVPPASKKKGKKGKEPDKGNDY